MKQLLFFIAGMLLSSFVLAQNGASSATTSHPGDDTSAGGAIIQNHADPLDMGIEKIGHEAFLKAPGLTDDQRTKLQAVLVSTMKEAGKIKMDIASQKVDFFRL